MDPTLYDDLSGQVALVTGATRGLGAAIADRLVELGATVYAGARDPADVTAEDRRVVELDVTDDDACAAAIARIDEEAGRLDVLVNNAGVMGPDANLTDTPVAEFDRVVETNFRGPVVLSRAALPLLLEQECPRIVNVASSMGQLNGSNDGGYPAYRMSKAALNGLTTTLDGDYAHRGLLVNAVCPGWTKTSMGGEEAPRSIAEGVDTTVWLCRFGPGSPSGLFWRDREPMEY